MEPPIPRLETDRLVLREWLEEDLEPFAAMNGDPAVTEFLSSPLERSASDALVGRIREHWTSDGIGLWAVERRADGAFLGFTGLTPPNFVAAFTPCVEVGWRFATFAWGQGYATEAGAAALRFGFDERQLDEIVSFTTVANVRSRAVMERLGMSRDPADDFDHPNLPPDHPLRPHVLYRLFRVVWRARVAASL